MDGSDISSSVTGICSRTTSGDFSLADVCAQIWFLPNHAPELSFLQVIQYTDLVWSSDETYISLDDAFAEMEGAIAKWCEEQGISLGDG